MIDWMIIVILIIALALFWIERCNRPQQQTEQFTDFPSKTLGVDYGATSPQQFGAQGMMPAGFSKWQSGYSKFGPTPPRPRCNVTVMGENCSNLPDSDNNSPHQSVCTSSYNTYPTGNRGFNYPLFVMGKSLGRVRQCRNMYDPTH